MLCCLLLFVLAACTKLTKVTNNDVIGDWIEVNATCHNDCAHLELFGDGHFEGKHIPTKYFGALDSLNLPSRINSDGTWILNEPTDPLNYYELELTFPCPPLFKGKGCYHTTTYIDRNEQDKIFTWYDDVTNKLTFQKKNNEVQ